MPEPTIFTMPACAVPQTKRIEDIAVGDWVWAWSVSASALVRARVTRLFRRADRPVLEIVYQSAGGPAKTICATTEHPFWVQGKGWMAASALLPGDQLKAIDATPRLTVLAVKDTGRRADVFNIEVEGQHNYHVGVDGVLVHNASDISYGSWSEPTGVRLASGAPPGSNIRFADPGEPLRIDSLEMLTSDDGLNAAGAEKRIQGVRGHPRVAAAVLERIQGVDASGGALINTSFSSAEALGYLTREAHAESVIRISGGETVPIYGLHLALSPKGEPVPVMTMLRVYEARSTKSIANAIMFGKRVKAAEYAASINRDHVDGVERVIHWAKTTWRGGEDFQALSGYDLDGSPVFGANDLRGLRYDMLDAYEPPFNAAQALPFAPQAKRMVYLARGPGAASRSPTTAVALPVGTMQSFPTVFADRLGGEGLKYFGVWPSIRPTARYADVLSILQATLEVAKQNPSRRGTLVRRSA